MKTAKFVPLDSFLTYAPDEMEQRAQQFYEELKRRRTVRHFSNQPVPLPVIEYAIKAAATAPNGANRQPWHFVVVANPEIKRKIREAAEAEEKDFYENKAPQEWLEALAVLGTDSHKPFLETAPFLIVIFAESYQVTADGRKLKNYYVQESVGIATGMLITALHHSGLATLTHTPSPMGFLNKILNRPPNERPFLILVVGYPAQDATVPEIKKKEFEEIVTFVE